MDYTSINLPQKTIELLRIVKDHDGEVNPILLANGCSDDENWPRIKQLIEFKLVSEEQGYDKGGCPNGPVLFITNEGKAMLSDHEAKCDSMKRERLTTIVISAATSAIVAWGPNILSWIQSLISKQ